MNTPAPVPVDPAFLRTLAQLRWFAALGQAVTIWVSLHQLDLPLPTAPLWMGVAALLLFNLYLRVRPPAETASAARALAHLGFDITELSWVIAWSGGAMNPFVSLFLVPIALSTLALPAPHIVLVAFMATVGYAVAAVYGLPLPHVHGISGIFDLHLVGMAVNFVLSAVVFVAVLTRLAALRDAREREIARLREQAARDEGILGLATHAAAMAHTLNTPLGTLTLIVDDLIEDSAAASEQRTDLERARTLVAHCRDQVRKLVHDADPDRHAQAPLREYVEAVIARWELLRPSLRLHKDIQLPNDPLRADPALEHLLQALLDNAADASVAQGQSELGLRLRLQHDELVGAVTDQGGTALLERPRSPTLYASTKRDGLGVGLALSHATVERYGGELTLEPGPEGAITRLRLPLQRLRP